MKNNKHMNVFENKEIALKYDGYYQTEFGKEIDKIEKNIVLNLIKEIPRDKMLELGCGTGHWSDFFVDQGFEFIGIDSSETMLNIAIANNGNLEFLYADSENLPFKEQSFSVISSITMLEFVNNQDEVLNEIYRVLKPNGWLILGCLNADSVLAKNKGTDETFKNAKFLSQSELIAKLQKFGNPKLDSGVYLSQDYQIFDNSEHKSLYNPVFLAAIVQKIK